MKEVIRRGRGRPRKYPRVEDVQDQDQQNKKVQKQHKKIKKPVLSKTHPPPPPLFGNIGSVVPGPVPEQEVAKTENGIKYFFKIIHSQIIRDRKLGIPMKFLRNISKDLSDFAILKTPRGPTWRVQLKKDNHRGGDVWFRNGWQDFVDYHNISPTDFLLFRYDRNSEFYVLIFDITGSEIDYLPSTTSAGATHPNDHDIKGTPFVTVKKEIIDEEEYMAANMAFVSPINGSSMKPKSSIVNPVSKMKDAQKALDHDSALMEAASQFKSEHPFFTVEMKPSYVNHKFVPVVSTFDKTQMPGDRGCIKIRGSDGQQWSVGILASESKREYRLSKGISAFLNDNHLKDGDVCVFELIKENEDIFLKSHIFQ